MSASAAILKEYEQYKDEVRVRNSKVACALVILLMPAGILLDWIVLYNKSDVPRYEQAVQDFLVLRVLCSILTGLVLWRLSARNLSRTETRLLCMGWWVLPAAAISWMIGVNEIAGTTYYAGLCLVILAVSTVIQATLKESLQAVLLILSFYVAACLFTKYPLDWRFIFHNLYFILLTAIIVVTGNHFYNQLRLREFTLRHELAESQKQLKAEKEQLDRNNQELAETIQKLKEAESQLVQSEKMASLGRMSAGIIHEINNPLNFATTGLFTLRKKAKHVAPEQQEEYTEILKDIEDGVTRVKNIVSDLRMFTHPNTEQLEQVSVGEVVSSAVRFLGNEMKNKATLELLVADSQIVRANKNKLIHVVVNLVQNSLDALKTKTFAAGATPYIWIETQHRPDATCLVVRDNGPGIAREHYDKIFDPFYTTKDVGEGMGLGLSICYRIMEECKGKITVRTTPGEFCEFTLEFPHSPT